jgi:hypothetical protein
MSAPGRRQKRIQPPPSLGAVTAVSLPSRDNYPVGGFIVLEDGRAYAAASWATDATLRAVSREVSDPALRAWLLAQQSEHVGMA